jgi:hypothetical protein
MNKNSDSKHLDSFLILEEMFLAFFQFGTMLTIGLSYHSFDYVEVYYFYS